MCVQLIEETGDDSISYGDEMAVVDNKPINNVYYQLKRLPQPAPLVMPEPPRPPMVIRPPRPVVIRPVPVPQTGNEVSLRRRGNFPECSLPPDAGDCTGEFIRIFFDDRKMSCEVFYYSGCGGNANRFTSIKACYDICSPHTATVKGPEVLSGKRYVIMPKPGAVEPVPMVSSAHPPSPHYDQEVADPSKVYYHADSESEKIPVSNGGYQQLDGEQMISSGEVKPSKVKVIRYSNRGGGGGQFPSPGMMMGGNMFPNGMGMGMPANF